MTTRADLNRSIDLWQLVNRDTALKKKASTKGGEYCGPCPFCGNGDDRFIVWPNHDSGYAQFWCRKCNLGGDGVAYIIARDNLTFRQVKKNHGRRSYTPAQSTPAQRPKPKPKTPTDDWRQTTQTLVDDCSLALWSARNSAARRWLHERGLTDATIVIWKLGYAPSKRGRVGLWHTGILIPWYDGAGRLWAVKVATGSTEQGEKYRAVSGSSFAGNLFGLDKLTGKTDVFITEGEFDAMLLSQEIGDLADVLTLGAADNHLDDRWLAALLPVQRFWIATDNDEAGEKAASYWLDLVGERAKRIYAPMGEKDVTDAHRAGADLRAWALAHLSESQEQERQERVIIMPAPEPQPEQEQPGPQPEPESLPVWHGRLMPIADLPQFKRDHGLRVVSSSWNGSGPVRAQAIEV